jgi:amino acid adenylation domain-containing protein
MGGQVSKVHSEGGGSAVALTMEAELASLLLQLARALGVSPREAVVGCFAALAYRHLQQSLIGIRVAGADSSEPNELTCAVTDNSTLPELAGALAEQWRMPRGAQPDAALFDVQLKLLDEPSADQHHERDAPERVELWSESASCARVQELTLQLEQLIRQAAVSAREALCSYSLVTPMARALLPDASLPIASPTYELVTERVLEQARTNPSRCALLEDEQRWSYQQLITAAGAVATRLRQEGVRAGDVVALCGRRGFAIVSAMLGVFLSGAVLLTLDPKLPAERRRAMLRQGGARHLLYLHSHEDLTDAAWKSLPLAQLTAGGSGLVTPSMTDYPPLERTAAAYIFFTSGSTGTPKAVVGTHAGLAHFLEWERSCLALGADTRAAQLISVSFDAVLRDVFVVLSCGGTLCIPAEEALLDPAVILAWLARERVTLVHMVPSLLRAWLSHVPDGLALPHLRHLLLSGEPLTDVLVERFRKTFGTHTQIVNLYGPTETTMVKCFHWVRELQPGVQPIGQPMPQTQVLILSPRPRLCGLEEPGQIAIRTPFRTLGYLGAPEATQRAFIRNPWRDDPEDLIYLTGDRGRYRSDGVLEVSGRIDHQLKIHGVRVEPGEIEYAICLHPDIHEAAVTAFEDSTAGKYLAAYLVAKDRRRLDERSLIARVREHLRSRLPEYMLPASFTVLDRLPLNANGKVDLKALPPPRRAAEPIAAEDRAQTPLEQRLATIWARALGRDVVGVNDSFGALGGDSLSSVGVIVTMKRAGIPDEAAKALFRGASIRQIAAQAQSAASNAAVRAHWGEIETPILVRALSIVLVVMGHFGPWDTQGTIKALLIVSGFSFARFQLQAIRRHDSIAPLSNTLVRLALPTLLYTLLLGVTLFRGLRLDTYLFFDNFVDPNVGGSPWFIELLLQCLLLSAAPLALRPVRRFALEKPYLYGLLFLGLWCSASRAVPLIWNTDHLYNRVPQILLWLMAYGWCVAFSNTLGKKLLSTALLLVCMRYTYEWFGWYPLAAGVLMTWLDRIPLRLPPSPLNALNSLAAASLFIYLTHMQFGSLAHKLGANAAISVIAAVLGGVLAWKAWEGLVGAVARLRRGLPILAAAEAEAQ